MIEIHSEPDGSINDHEYFSIHEDLFGRIQSTHQENNILLKIISNETNSKDSQYEATDTIVKNIFKKRVLLSIICLDVLFRERGIIAC